MEVRSEVMQQALKGFIDDMFSKTELNLRNAVNAIGAKVIMHNKVGQFLPMLENEKGLIDVDFLEGVVQEEVKKMGSIIIPAIGTTYKLNEQDVQNLFAKVRTLGE